MIFEKNGLRIDFKRDGSSVSFEVLAQSPAATNIIRSKSISVDGWSLKSNVRPSINREEKEFFVRGSDRSKDNKVYIGTFASVAAAKAAEAALPKLLDMVVSARYEVVNGESVDTAAASWAVEKLRQLYRDAAGRGNGNVIALHRLVTSLRGPDNESEAKKQATTRIRKGIFGSAIAKILKVSDKDSYPTYPTWSRTVNPPTIANDHLQEHINQAWDVLDKA